MHKLPYLCISYFAFCDRRLYYKCEISALPVVPAWICLSRTSPTTLSSPPQHLQATTASDMIGPTDNKQHEVSELENGSGSQHSRPAKRGHCVKFWWMWLVGSLTVILVVLLLMYVLSAQCAQHPLTLCHQFPRWSAQDCTEAGVRNNVQPPLFPFPPCIFMEGGEDTINC